MSSQTARVAETPRPHRGSRGRRCARSLVATACGAAALLAVAGVLRLVTPAGGVSPSVPRGKEDPLLHEVLPFAAAFVEAEAAPKHHIGLDETGAPVGYVVLTTDAAPEESKGFNGPVPVLVGLDTTGRIVALKPLEHQEDMEYSGQVFSPEHLGRFIGQPASEIHVDAVSGATYSSGAVLNGVRASVQRVADAEGIGTKAPTEAAPAPSAWRQPGTYVLVGLFAAALVGYAKRWRRLRLATLALSTAFLGFWWTNLLSIRHFSDVLAAALDALWALASGAGAAISWAAFWRGLGRNLPLVLGLFGALFVGRVWCGWICPFGAITELLGRLTPRRLRLRIPPRADRAMRRAKYALLFIGAAGVAGTGWRWLQQFEPFADTLRLNFLRRDFPTAGLVWLIVLGSASLVSVRFYCKYLCPVGAALGYVSLQRLVPRRKPSGCRECPRCHLDCLVAQRTSPAGPPSPPLGECLACEECAQCPRFPVETTPRRHGSGAGDAA